MCHKIEVAVEGIEQQLEGIEQQLHFSVIDLNETRDMTQALVDANDQGEADCCLICTKILPPDVKLIKFPCGNDDAGIHATCYEELLEYYKKEFERYFTPPIGGADNPPKFKCPICRTAPPQQPLDWNGTEIDRTRFDMYKVSDHNANSAGMCYPFPPTTSSRALSALIVCTIRPSSCAEHGRVQTKGEIIGCTNGMLTMFRDMADYMREHGIEGTAQFAVANDCMVKERGMYRFDTSARRI